MSNLLFVQEKQCKWKQMKLCTFAVTCTREDMAVVFIKEQSRTDFKKLLSAPISHSELRTKIHNLMVVLFDLETKFVGHKSV